MRSTRALHGPPVRSSPGSIPMTSTSPGAVAQMVSVFQAHPDVQWLYGNCRRFDERTGSLSELPSTPFSFPDALCGSSPICQPSAFMRRSLLDRVGWLDESFTLALDYDLWLRAYRHARPMFVADTFAIVIDHPRTKSQQLHGEFVFESTKAIGRFFAGPSVPAEAAPFRRRAMAHLYAECAASAILTRKSFRQAIPWFARAVASDPHMLLETPLIARQLVRRAVTRG